MENEAFENNDEFDTSLDRQTSEVDLEVGGVASNTNEGDAEGILSNEERGELPLLPYRNWYLGFLCTRPKKREVLVYHFRLNSGIFRIPELSA